MAFLEHRPRVYYSLTAVAEATALLFVQHVKSAIIVDHVTTPHGQIWPNITRYALRPHEVIMIH